MTLEWTEFLLLMGLWRSMMRKQDPSVYELLRF